MNARHVVIGLVVALVALLGVGVALAQEPEMEADAKLLASVGTAFTYQGRLLDGGRPANGTYDFEFSLFATDTTPAPVLEAVVVEDVTVTDGTFTAVVDFGAGYFPGEARWMSIAVRPGDSTGGFTSLEPLQQLRPAPYAMTAGALALPMTQTVSTETAALRVDNAGAEGLVGASSCDGGRCVGVFGLAPSSVGVLGCTQQGDAVRADISLSGHGDLFLGGVYRFGGFPPHVYYDPVFRVDAAGKVYADGNYQVGDADIGEFIDASGILEPGDVVEIDPENAGQFRLAATANSPLVAGVISTDPGVSLGAQGGAETEDTRPQLALAGTTPVKVCDQGGAIGPGDLLVASSVAGHAMTAPADPAPGTVIGKALGSLESGSGVMRMLVMMR